MITLALRAEMVQTLDAVRHQLRRGEASEGDPRDLEWCATQVEEVMGYLVGTPVSVAARAATALAEVVPAGVPDPARAAARMAAAEGCAILEYDAAFKCFTHDRVWGAITNPDRPCVPANAIDPETLYNTVDLPPGFPAASTLGTGRFSVPVPGVYSPNQLGSGGDWLARYNAAEERKRAVISGEVSAYASAAADPDFVAEMEEVDRAFDTTVGDGLTPPTLTTDSRFAGGDPC